MVFFYRTPQAIIISTICSIAIAAFIYFVIVKPETDKANDTVNHSLQQAQPGIDRANRELQQAQPGINEANKKLKCIQEAGSDVNKIAACND